MDVAAPQCQDPVVDLYGRRIAMIRVVVAKKKPKYGFMPPDIHVVRPHDEAQSADRTMAQTIMR